MQSVKMWDFAKDGEQVPAKCIAVVERKGTGLNQIGNGYGSYFGRAQKVLGGLGIEGCFLADEIVSQIDEFVVMAGLIDQDNS